MSANRETVSEAQLQAFLESRASELHAWLERRISPPLQRTIAVDDVLQEIWIAAFRDAKNFRADGPDALDRWLAVISRSTLAGVLRAAGRQRRGGDRRFVRDNELPPTPSSSLFAALQGPERSPSSSAHLREAAQVLRREIEHLEPARREAVKLHFLEGLSLQETARRMGKSTAAVRSLVYRACVQLRDWLGGLTKWFSDARSSAADRAERADPREN